MKAIAVITTINFPTAAVKKVASLLPVIIVADKKTPKNWQLKNTTLIPFDGGFPQNHYARKNIGYLEAIKEGAEIIYDTDDDNTPNENWEIRSEKFEGVSINEKGWYNVYHHFTDEVIWPRGFSLRHLSKEINVVVIDTKICDCPIQQGLANLSPDVDAIWRLTNNRELYFENICSVELLPKAWCPFNSQTTWWYPAAYPLMYLPVYATFRMTDIWRSFVAQRCLWQIGKGVAFHSPAEVYQDRNPHDLMKDFEDEVSGYLNNERIVAALEALTLSNDMCENLYWCYRELVRINVLPEAELESVSKWITDIRKI